MTILKCPFCGSNDLTMDADWERYTKPYHLTCCKCGAEGPCEDSEKKAKISWNRRVGE